MQAFPMNRKLIVLMLGGAAMAIALGAQTQERSTFPKEAVDAAKRGEGQFQSATTSDPPAASTVPGQHACRGPVSQVIDTASEGLKFTSAVYGTNPGGGEGRQFDKTPVLSTTVKLAKGHCLDAHLSVIVGSAQTYGVSNLALFQVTLTPVNGSPRHMVGHYETPYGLPSPAVALEAERDVDMYASNFFQRVGSGPHEVKPGTYRVDVWWAGGPNPGGAIGAAFVLKLYLR